MAHPPRIARWSGWTPSLWFCGTLLSLILGSAPVSAVYALAPAALPFSGMLTLQNDKLTARITGTPLRQVMEEIGKLHGAQVLWLGKDGEEPVSVEFTALPLSDALRRILGEKNFLLFYTPAKNGTKLSQIWISSKGQGRAQLVVIPQLPSDPSSQSEGDTDTLIHVALHGPDPLGRLDAVTQLGGHAEEDPRVKTILSQVAQRDTSPQVRDAAAEILHNLESK